MLLQSYNIIIERGVSAPGHDKEVVDGLNTTFKGFFSVNINCATNWF